MSNAATRPTFSVIIASYNAASTLATAIDSVLAQSYPAAEIIVVDDGSSDNTAAVVSRYGDAVRYFQQANAGVSSARNQGAKLATAEWLAFLDADDVYYPQRLQLHAELLQRQADLDFLIADYHYGRADGSISKRALETTAFGLATLAKQDGYACRVLAGEDLGALIPEYFGHTLTFTVPTARFLALGGYPLSFSIGEDLHLLIRLCASSQKVGVCCQPLGLYYVHDAGLMRSNLLQAQVGTVATLSSLNAELRDAPAPIRKGFLRVLENARFDLATALLRQGQHWQAVKAFWPAVVAAPTLRCVRMLLSVLKG